MFLRRTATLVALLMSCFWAAAAQASPLFGVGDCTGCVSWQDAIIAGNVVPAPSGLTAEEDAYYLDNLGSPNFAISSNIEVFANPVVVDGNATAKDSLVMSWEEEGGTDLTVAAWEYVYGVDPDLTDTLIEFSALAPTGIWDLSIELIDVNGRVRGWFIDGTTLVNNVWTTFELDPTDPNAPGFIPGPIQDPLFDITQVVRIRLDEAGMTATIFAPPPVGGAIVGQWNAWDHLIVKAKPQAAPSLTTLGTVLVAGLLLLSIAIRRRHLAQ